MLQTIIAALTQQGGNGSLKLAYDHEIMFDAASRF